MAHKRLDPTELSKPKLPDSWKAPIGEFLSHLLLELGYSQLTVSTYEHSLVAFARFCRRQQRLRSWNSVVPNSVRAWIMELAEKKAHSNAVRKHLSALRSHAKYQIRHNDRTDYYMHDIMSPARPKSLPNSLTTDEASRLVEFFDGEDRYSLRNRLILELFYAAGVRVSELITLKPSDVDPEHRTVFVKER